MVPLLLWFLTHCNNERTPLLDDHIFNQRFSALPHPISVSVDAYRHHDIKALFLAELLIDMLIFLSVKVERPAFYCNN
jgi:hypothetical protein